MWVILTDCFFSIVEKDCARNELLVRARRPGDIQKVFPKANVRRTPKDDYLFRAAIKRDDVMLAMENEVRRINYPNFKDAVADDALHLAYLRVWTSLEHLQPNSLQKRRRALLPLNY